jgi:hypothetical protein
MSTTEWRKEDWDAKKCVCMEQGSIYRQQIWKMKREGKVTAQDTLNACRPDVKRYDGRGSRRLAANPIRTRVDEKNWWWNPNDNDIRVVQVAMSCQDRESTTCLTTYR